MVVTYLSINAKGLNSPFKRSMLWKEAKKCQVDLVCVQKTRFSASSPLKMKNWNYPHIFMASSKRKKGGALIAVKDSVAFQLHHACGRYIILICTIDNVICTIVNVYAPNAHQLSFLNKIWKKIGESIRVI